MASGDFDGDDAAADILPASILVNVTVHDYERWPSLDVCKVADTYAGSDKQYEIPAELFEEWRRADEALNAAENKILELARAQGRRL
jgi:hypothetical protein